MNTAATGLAAAINGAQTVHGAFALGGGITETHPKELVAKSQASNVGDVLKEAEILIVDEYMLLPTIVMEAVCLAIEAAKNAENAHAAVHLFIACDNKQLLCFDKRQGDPLVTKWCKNAAIVPCGDKSCYWRDRAENAGFRYHELKICHRQLNDPIPEFLPMLDLVRDGHWNDAIIHTMETKLGQKNPAKVVTIPNGFKKKGVPEQVVDEPNGSVVLVLKNDRKNWFNGAQLEKNKAVGNPIVSLRALDGLGTADLESYKFGDPDHDKYFKKVPAIIRCAVNAPVRTVRKTKGKILEGEGEITVPPGTMGVIAGFEHPESSSPQMRVIIDFVANRGRPACRVVVGRLRFEISEGAPEALVMRIDSRLQLPFDLAYAATFSSFQGGEAENIVLDFAGYDLGWLPHSPYLGLSRGLWGPGMRSINIPKPKVGFNINAISPLMIELDGYIAKQKAAAEAENDEPVFVTMDIISRLQVCSCMYVCYKDAPYPNPMIMPCNMM
jgi:hypothetical protein